MPHQGWLMLRPAPSALPTLTPEQTPGRVAASSWGPRAGRGQAPWAAVQVGSLQRCCLGLGSSF